MADAITTDTVTAGGNGKDGTVPVRGADGLPLVELLGRTNESVVGLGQQKRPARMTSTTAPPRKRSALTSADATIRLGGTGLHGTGVGLGVDGMSLLELLGRVNEIQLRRGPTPTSAST